MPYIGNQPGTGVRNRFIYTATASQTTFTGADNNSKTLKYADSNYIDVYLNGVCLEPGTDYTASTKTSVVLTQAASLNDTLKVIAYDVASMDDSISKADGGTFEANVTFADGADIITGSAGTSNFRAGVNAGNSIASGGNYNVAVGDEAGTAITTGDYNSVVGYKAGEKITTGSQNTIMGGLAGEDLTVGENNVALGMQTLRNDTKGSRSVAIGLNALETQNFTSATNVYNTAVGALAGTAITTGTHNTFIGGEAGDAITTSNSNTAVGYNALSAETSSNGNTAVGEGALQTQNVGGSGDARNTAVGLLAGSEITSGHSNTCIGYLAGDDLTTGTQNVFVGYDATSASSSDGNQIVMGYVVDSIGGNYFTFGNNSIGRVYNQFSSNASWTRTSDERIKKDIEANTDLGLDFINDLRTVTYKWKAPSEHPEEFKSYNAEQTEAAYTEKMYGFIAQEVKAAMDTHNITDFAGWHIVAGDGDQQGVSYEMFVMPLVKAVQELSAKVDALETENTAIKARLDALEAG